MTRIKICGLTRIEDARAAEAAGAHWMGAVLVPGSPRRVDPEQARALADAVSLPLAVVVADLPPEEAAEAARRSGARAIQLHGGEPPEALVRLRGEGEWELWKAVRVRSGTEALEAARTWGAGPDLLLLDGWHPTRLGGTGSPFPWQEVEALRDRFPPGPALGAAGGLDPENVGEAIRRLRPWLVDASSGLESRPGIKDPARIRAFVAAVETARGASSRNP